FVERLGRCMGGERCDNQQKQDDSCHGEDTLARPYHMRTSIWLARVGGQADDTAEVGQLGSAVEAAAGYPGLGHKGSHEWEYFIDSILSHVIVYCHAGCHSHVA